MLDFSKRMMLIALRDRLVTETGSTAHATVIAEHAFGWTLDEADRNMKAVHNSVIVDGQCLSRLSDDTYLLETGDRSLVIDDGFLQECTLERQKALKRAMVHLNPVS